MKRTRIKKIWDRCVQSVKNAWNKVISLFKPKAQ